MPTALRLTTLIAAAVLALTGCGSEEENASKDSAATESSATAEASPSADSSPKAKPTNKPEGTTIEVTFRDGEVDPAGVQRKVEAGEPIVFRIEADQPGELHVHSSPEQEIAYRAGTTKQTITIAQPGLVDVEAHDPDTLVVKLEVR